MSRGPKVAAPADTSEIAVSLARHGWPVFPVSIYEDSDGKRHKVPAVKWKDEATTDLATVRAWWAGEHSGRWIGVYAGKAGIVTLDLDPGHEDAVAREGLEIPATFNYPTHREGGRHHIYRAPAGVELTIDKNVVGPSGERMEGIDVRAGSGLMVYYGPKLKGAPDLAPAPDWLLVAASRTRERHQGGEDRDRSATEDAFRDRLMPGKAPKALRREVRAVQFPAGAAHEPMLEAVSRLVFAGVKGEPGIAPLLDETRERYVAGHPDRPRDWENAVTGSVRRFGLPPMSFEITETERQEIERRITEEVVEEKELEKRATDSETFPAAGDDATLAEIVAAHFRPSLIFAAGAWYEYDGTRWGAVSDAHVVELVRSRLLDLGVRAYLAPDGSKLAAWLKRKTTIDAAARLIRGILERSAADFDAHPDEINTPSGIVDLRTGELRPHDPDRLHTKVTRSAWGGIEARHPDVQSMLDALPAKVRDWMQVRFGQGATGHVPDDDVVPIEQGGGQNGKSTINGAVLGALGDYAAILSEQVLLAAQGDHPTALMDLHGLRLGISEELPEGHSLNVKRLKDVAGTPRMRARRMRQDFVQWTPTHSLMISSNYDPRVAETDHGTWRRLALVRFPYRFVADPQHEDERLADRRLRGRVNGGKAGRDEAVLAWIVRGAKRWYDAGMIMPEPPRRVVEATNEWRERSDVAFAFANDRLVFGPEAYMSASDLVEAVRTWLNVNGHRAWNTETIVGRVASHDMFRDNNVRKDRKRLPDGTRPTYYFGVGLRPHEAVLNDYLATQHTHH